MGKLPLSEFRVVITRPKEQAKNLSALCLAAGANPVLAPMLQIAANQLDATTVLSQLAVADWAIFTSANAVEYAMILCKSSFPSSLQIACVGRRTAAVLKAYGVSNVLVPATTFDSEGLLQLAPLQAVSNRVFIIFTGKSGRQVLHDTLTARGAIVTLAEVYQRKPTVKMDQDLRIALAQRTATAIFISSGEILQNFMSLYGETVTMNSAVVFVVASHRIAVNVSCKT